MVVNPSERSELVVGCRWRVGAGVQRPEARAVAAGSCQTTRPANLQLVVALQRVRREAVVVVVGMVG